MDAFINILKEHLMNIDLEGPSIFVIVIMAVLVIFRKWGIFLLILLTIVLGWGAENLIITNLTTNMEIISIPLLIYCIGGGTIVILVLISFFKSSL